MVKKKICVYCGSDKKPMSKEHAIAKSLFTKENRKDLISVPCCIECNNSSSKDVEEFRITLLIEESVIEKETAKDMNPSVIRAIKRKAKSPFVSDLIKNTGVEIFTKDGEVKNRFPFSPDMGILQRVVKRSVQCLYFHHFGKVIPKEYRIDVIEKSQLENSGINYLNFRISLDLTLDDKPTFSVGNGTCVYTYMQETKYKYISVWKLTFYNSKEFFVLVRESSIV